MKRQTPTWRIPVGILSLCIALLIYGLVIANYVPPIIAGWPALAQLPVYIVLGFVWLLPLRRFLIWMETGSWSPPGER